MPTTGPADPETSVAIAEVLGLGLATAILIDATIVRLVLVPATMARLGRANWWLPSWLDRALPHLTVDDTADRSQELPTAHTGRAGVASSTSTADQMARR